MSFTTPTSVPSGVTRRVIEVGGHGPTGLSDFDGDADFTLEDGFVVRGTGRIDGDHSRFHEKDVTSGGKDIRVWSVCREGDDFLAETTANF